MFAVCCRAHKETTTFNLIVLLQSLRTLQPLILFFSCVVPVLYVLNHFKFLVPMYPKFQFNSGCLKEEDRQQKLEDILSAKKLVQDEKLVGYAPHISIAELSWLRMGITLLELKIYTIISIVFINSFFSTHVTKGYNEMPNLRFSIKLPTPLTGTFLIRTPFTKLRQ